MFASTFTSEFFLSFYVENTFRESKEVVEMKNFIENIKKYFEKHKDEAFLAGYNEQHPGLKHHTLNLITTYDTLEQAQAEKWNEKIYEEEKNKYMELLKMQHKQYYEKHPPKQYQMLPKESSDNTPRLYLQEVQTDTLK